MKIIFSIKFHIRGNHKMGIKKPSTMRASKKMNINKQGKMKKILTLI